MRIAKEQGVKVQVKHHQKPTKIEESNNNEGGDLKNDDNNKKGEEHENGSVIIQVEMVLNEKR